MNKVKKQQTEKITYEVGQIIWSNIRRYQYLNQLSDEQLAESFGVSTRTLYSYNKNPSTLTLKHIQCFLNDSGLTMQDLTNC